MHVDSCSENNYYAYDELQNNKYKYSINVCSPLSQATPLDAACKGNVTACQELAHPSDYPAERDNFPVALGTSDTQTIQLVNQADVNAGVMVSYTSSVAFGNCASRGINIFIHCGPGLVILADGVRTLALTHRLFFVIAGRPCICRREPKERIELCV